jgi:hypothetical protein
MFEMYMVEPQISSSVTTEHIITDIVSTAEVIGI